MWKRKKRKKKWREKYEHEINVVFELEEEEKKKGILSPKDCKILNLHIWLFAIVSIANIAF